MKLKSNNLAILFGTVAGSVIGSICSVLMLKRMNKSCNKSNYEEELRRLSDSCDLKAKEIEQLKEKVFGLQEDIKSSRVKKLSDYYSYDEYSKFDTDTIDFLLKVIDRLERVEDNKLYRNLLEMPLIGGFTSKDLNNELRVTENFLIKKRKRRKKDEK